jgi:hypothetical protein
MRERRIGVLGVERRFEVRDKNQHFGLLFLKHEVPNHPKTI